MMSKNKTTPSVRLYAAGDPAACEAIFLSNVPRFFSAGEFEEFRKFLAAPNAQYLVLLDGRDLWRCVCGWQHRVPLLGNGASRVAWAIDRLVAAGWTS